MKRGAAPTAIAGQRPTMASCRITVVRRRMNHGLLRPLPKGGRSTGPAHTVRVGLHSPLMKDGRTEVISTTTE